MLYIQLQKSDSRLQKSKRTKVVYLRRSTLKCASQWRSSWRKRRHLTFDLITLFFETRRTTIFFYFVAVDDEAAADDLLLLPLISRSRLAASEDRADSEVDDDDVVALANVDVVSIGTATRFEPFVVVDVCLVVRFDES